MNKDQVEGKVKDVAGRIERQAGEWTGDKKKEVHGAVKQVEGKLQNAWGKAKNAGRRATDKNTNPDQEPADHSVETEVQREVKQDEEDIRSLRRNVS
ncbi:MAG: CsbD family protein [Candidatus Sulfotelmatobacter sp.]